MWLKTHFKKAKKSRRTYQNFAVTLHQEKGPRLAQRQAELEQREEEGNVVLAGK